MVNNDFLYLIAKYVKYGATPDELTEDTDLKSVGLDSMSSIDLLLEIEEKFEVVFPDEYLVSDTFSTPKILWEAMCSIKKTEKMVN